MNEKSVKPLLIAGVALLVLLIFKNFDYSDVNYSEKPTIMRIWVTNTGDKPVTPEMTSTMESFMDAAIEFGCISAIFADDNERAIAFTIWPNKETLDVFKKSKPYEANVDRVLAAFVSAGFEFPGDILFNTDVKILSFVD